jgi:hypothetical protein
MHAMNYVMLPTHDDQFVMQSESRYTCIRVLNYFYLRFLKNFLNIMQYIEMNISNRNYDYASYQFQNL